MADSQSEWPSPIRVLFLGALGSTPRSAKALYLQKHFRDVSVPVIKHSNWAAAMQTIRAAITQFKPDIIVAHGAGVSKVVNLAMAGEWTGPLLLLALGRDCAAVQNLDHQVVTLLLAKQEPDTKACFQAMQARADPSWVRLLQVDDDGGMNAFLVGKDRLRHLVVETVARHRSPPEPAGAAAALEAVSATSLQDQVRWLFSESDVNNDGYIGREEFHNLFKFLDPSITAEQLDELLQLADSNADGRLDVDEFLSWVFSGGPGTEAILRETTVAPACSLLPEGGAPEDAADSSTLEAGAAPAAADDAQVAAAEAPQEEEQEAAGGGAELADEPAVTTAEPQEEEAEEEGEEGEEGEAEQEPAAGEAASAADGEAAAVAAAASSSSGPPGEAAPAPGCPPFPVEPGQLFTWGRNTDGQLGQDRFSHPKPNCALPYPVRGLHNVVHVACGGGQQGCTAAVTADGQLFTFGSNFGKRLGHGDGPSVREPRRVEALAKEFVLMAACGPDHAAALVRGGRVFMWGGNRRGQLGRGAAAAAQDFATPLEVALPAPAVFLDCEDMYSAAVLEDGRLFAWGGNAHGRLGVGSEEDCPAPTEAKTDVAVASIGLGSLYAGAVGRGGELLMWGYGGHGNLGLGNRKSVSVPTRVELEEPAVQVACTRGQEGCKGGLYPKAGGAEGPHTVVLGASGAMYTMGTCHKGLLCNLGSKDGAFGKPWDELRPYKVGGDLRNHANDPPLSPLAVWPPPYDKGIGPQIMVVSGHIHAACVGRDGRAWAWGCGSNDGRCGVERFLNMKGEGRPPEMDLMKCYMMGPHRIGVARPLYWKHPSLRDFHVLFLATGRAHMAAIAKPSPGGPVEA